MGMNKHYIICIAVAGGLIIAGFVYFFIFNNFSAETDSDAENIIIENEMTGNIKYEFTNQNVFSGLGDDSQNEAETAEDIAIQEAQELANPYADIEEKANPFKSSYENPFE